MQEKTEAQGAALDPENPTRIATLNRDFHDRLFANPGALAGGEPCLRKLALQTQRNAGATTRTNSQAANASA